MTTPPPDPGPVPGPAIRLPGPLTEQQGLDLARAAHQAPSIHNTQPWRLRALPDGLDVLEDPDRALQGTDPRGRDRVISCGAAVRNAEVALARLGFAPVTTVLPDGDGARRVASVRAGAVDRGSAQARARAEQLYRAVWTRRTHRRIFLSNQGPTDLPDAVRDAARGAGVRLEEVPPARRGRFAQLLWEAAQLQAVDGAVAPEVRNWTRARHGGTETDGVPVRSHGTAPFPVDGLLLHPVPVSPAAPQWVTDDLAQGAVAVLLTSADTRADWVRAGIALEAVLLAVTAAGLVASFINQPVQQEAFRPRLAALTGGPGYPQAVLRIGRALVDVPATPRRPLVEVTTRGPG